MQRLAFFLRATWLVPLLAIGLLLTLYWYAAAPGLRGTGDSRYYLFAARSLLATGHLRHPDGTAYRYWPPLYPLLLASLGASLGAIRVLHAVALAGTLAVWAWLGRQLLPSGRAVLYPLLLACGTPLLVVSKFVWAETVFALLAAVYMLTLWKWRRTRRTSWGVAATVAGALLPLHRTAGLFVLTGIGVAMVVEYVQARTDSAQAERKPVLSLPKLLLHGAGCMLGGVIWHWYALLIAAPIFYQQNRGWAQFVGSAADYGLVLTRWLLPVRASWRADTVGLAWALVLPVLLLAAFPIRARESGAEPVAAQPAKEPAGTVNTDILLAETERTGATFAFRRLLWWVVVVYVLIMLVSTTFTRSAAGLYDAERYASVLFAPFLLLILTRFTGSATAPGKLLLNVVLGLVLLYNAGRAVQNARQLRRLPVLTVLLASPAPVNKNVNPKPSAAPAAGQNTQPVAAPLTGAAADAVVAAQSRPAALGQSAVLPGVGGAR
jgi:hypothetical protein